MRKFNKYLTLVLSFALILNLFQASFVFNALNSNINLATVYVSTNGSDENDGLTANTAFATIAKAESVIEADTTATEGKIILVDTGTDVTEETEAVPATYTYSSAAHTKLITITAEEPTTVLNAHNKILQGPMHFDDLYINGNIYCEGYGVSFGDNMNISEYTRLYLANGYDKGVVRDTQNVYIKDFDNQGNWTFCTVRIGHTTGKNNLFTLNGDFNLYAETLHSHQLYIDGGVFNGNVNFVIEKGLSVIGSGNKLSFYGSPEIKGALQVVLNNGVERSKVIDLADIRTKATCDYYLIESAVAKDGSFLTTTEDKGIFKVNGNMVANAYKIDVTSVPQDDGSVTYTETVSTNAVKSVDGILNLSHASGEYYVEYEMPQITDSVVYVSSKGSDNNNGKTLDTAFGTLEFAMNWIALSSAKTKKIIVDGDYTFTPVSYDGMITLTSADGESVISIGDKVFLSDITFDNVVLSGYGYSNGNKVVLTENAVISDSKSGIIVGATSAEVGKQDEVIINAGGPNYWSGGLRIGANSTIASNGLKVTYNGGLFNQFIFSDWAKGGTHYGDVNVVFNAALRGGCAGIMNYPSPDTPHIFKGALQFVFNNGTSDSMLSEAVRSMAVEKGVWYMCGVTGGSLDTTETAGVFTVGGAKYAKAVNREDTTKVYYSKDGVLTVNEQGIYDVTFYGILNGDVTNDGSLDGTDLAEVMKSMLKVKNNKNFDLNGDNVYDIRDLVSLKNEIAEITDDKVFVRENKYGISEYSMPEKLMTETEYRSRVDLLKENRNLTDAERDFYNELEWLRNDLYDMIFYNSESVEVTGQKYYVSNSGNDSNDGTTPETAWATLEKVRTFEFSSGDGVYFKRGDRWYGNTKAQSGVTYSAYGEGKKPEIYYSYTANEESDWIQTDTPDIWMYKDVLNDRDIGLILFNGGEKYAEKRRNRENLTSEFDFYYSAEISGAEEFDNRLYIYSPNGNPASLFETIDISRAGSIFEMDNDSHDIVINNLAIRFGQDYFFPTGLVNTEVSYCTFAWMGGGYISVGGSRAGGGGGAWRSCDNLNFHHCYFTQQFDCASSPQLSSSVGPEAVFKDYSLTDCLIEYTEYSFEFFNNQSNSETNRYENMNVSYNIMRFCGKGFGDKPTASRNIKGWNFSENRCFDCVFESNVFDRAESMSIEVTSRSDNFISKEDPVLEVSYELLPKFNGNIYIEPKGKQYAEINRVTYTFDEQAQTTLKELGVEKDSVFVFVPQE